MKAVELPEFYVALVLEKTSSSPCKGKGKGKEEPNQAQLEVLRRATIDYLVQHLQSNSFPTLTRLELDFTSLQHGSQKPEPRFQVYWEVKATAHFTPAKNTTTTTTTTTPKPQKLFGRVGDAFNREYVRQTVRPVVQSALEVQMEQLTDRSPGGAVKAPAFYMGFVCETEPFSDITEDEKDRLCKLAHQEFVQHLQNAHPAGEFKDLSLKIVKTEIGDRAGKPKPKFNLYVQFEAVGTFVQNTPEPLDFFRVLTKIMSPAFMLGLHTNIGTATFPFIEQMAVRVCVWIEEKEPEPEFGEWLVAAKPCDVHIEFFVALVVRALERIADAKQIAFLDRHLTEFFSTLLAASYPNRFIDMVLAPEGAKFQAGRPLPRFNMLHEYQATLKFYHPPPEPEQILSKIVLCNVVALLAHINGSSSSSSSSSLIWNQTAEVTLGRGVAKRRSSSFIYHGKINQEDMIAPPLPLTKLKKNSTEKPSAMPKSMRRPSGVKPPKHVEEKPKPPQKCNRPLAATPPKKVEEQPKPPQPRKLPPAVTPPKKVEEKPKPPQMCKRPLAPPPRPEKTKETIVTKKVEEKPIAPRIRKRASKTPPPEKPKKKVEKKVEKKAETPKKTKSPPLSRPTPTPTPTPPPKEPEPALANESVSVKTSDVFVAMKIQDCNTGPTEEDYRVLLPTTMDFYTTHLQECFGKNFQEVDVSVHRALFDSGKPKDFYNVYVEWNISARFADGATAPDRHKLCKSLVQLEIIEYLKNNVRSLSETPFANAIAIYTEQVNS